MNLKQRSPQPFESTARDELPQTPRQSVKTGLQSVRSAHPPTIEPQNHTTSLDTMNDAEQTTLGVLSDGQRSIAGQPESLSGARQYTVANQLARDVLRQDDVPLPDWLVEANHNPIPRTDQRLHAAPLNLQTRRLLGGQGSCQELLDKLLLESHASAHQATPSGRVRRRSKKTWPDLTTQLGHRLPVRTPIELRLSRRLGLPRLELGL